ncbi:hypothetical protein KP509_13G082700 [Ceratopteris richardii]|uniref:Uncharacterized protein n=1 Tax=Ceratopteris richardii TaxID=49495 RepID=A0A8T2TJE5_CERRI|nr:hypothetical protein KP509_13G082700 [Ceratopteris richardii]
MDREAYRHVKVHSTGRIDTTSLLLHQASPLITSEMKREQASCFRSPILCVPMLKKDKLSGPGNECQQTKVIFGENGLWQRKSLRYRNLVRNVNSAFNETDRRTKARIGGTCRFIVRLRKKRVQVRSLLRLPSNLLRKLSGAYVRIMVALASGGRWYGSGLANHSLAGGALLYPTNPASES